MDVAPRYAAEEVKNEKPEDPQELMRMASLISGIHIDRMTLEKAKRIIKRAKGE